MDNSPVHVTAPPPPGLPAPVDPDLVDPEPVAQDIAAEALAQARRVARAAPRRASAAGRRQVSGARPADSRGGTWSGPGRDDARDPARVGDVVTGYLDERGWQGPIAQARVFTDWPHLVGAELAAHCAPVALNDGELRIGAESTAWATQLRMLAGTLLARLVAELGDGVVRRLVITGPTAPTWTHGMYRVRGRGQRDTYG